MSTSAAQRRANARNAQSSTGPRTAEGKMRSAQNATRHGIFSSRLLLPGEDPHDLAELRAGLMKRLKPIDALETLLAERVVICSWKLRRVLDAEQAVFAERLRKREQVKFEAHAWSLLHPNPVPPPVDPANEDDDDDVIPQSELERARITKDLIDQQLDPQPSAANTLIASDHDKDFDRLARYEAMQERSMYKALKELRELKKLREADDAEPWVDDEAMAHNEPNHGEVEEGVAEVAENVKGAEGAKEEEMELAQNEPNFRIDPDLNAHITLNDRVLRPTSGVPAPAPLHERRY